MREAILPKRARARAPQPTPRARGLRETEPITLAATRPEVCYGERCLPQPGRRMSWEDFQSWLAAKGWELIDVGGSLVACGYGDRVILKGDPHDGATLYRWSNFLLQRTP